MKVLLKTKNLENSLISIYRRELSQEYDLHNGHVNWLIYGRNDGLLPAVK